MKKYLVKFTDLTGKHEHTTDAVDPAAAIRCVANWFSWGQPTIKQVFEVTRTAGGTTCYTRIL